MSYWRTTGSFPCTRGCGVVQARCHRRHIRLRAWFLKTLARVALLALTLPLLAQAPGVTVNTTLLDGQGNPDKQGYLTFQLWNCGPNVPQIKGTGGIVQAQFTIRANASTGLISGSIYGQDQILCGNVESTQWFVTPFKATNQAGGIGQYYCLNSGNVFDISTAQPCQLPALPPGFAPIFANPIKSQVLTQPSGTELRFVGLFDFTDATVLGIGGSGNTSITCVIPMVCSPSTIVSTGNVSILPFVGDSGTGGVAGSVPAPPSGSAAAGKYLAAGGSWSVPAGGGGSIPNPFVVNSNIPGTQPVLPGTSTTTIGIGTDAKLSQAANHAQFFDDFLTKADTYEADTFNWEQFPSSPSSLTAGTPATVTINCTRGIDTNYLVVNGDTLSSDYWITVGTTGTAETVPVTATTCTASSGVATGTVTFTPANSHGAGYSLAQSGQLAIQETINYAEGTGSPGSGTGKYIRVLIPCGWWTQNAPVITHGNFVMLDGQGCAAILTNHVQEGVILGDQGWGDDAYFFNGVKDLAVLSGWTGSTPKVNLISSVTQSGAPGPCTYTVTFTANHDFYNYEQVVLGGFLEYNNIAGVRQIASIPAANEITFTTNSCTALVGQIYSGGYVIADNTGIEDNLSTDGFLLNTAIGGGVDGKVGYSYGFTDIDDQNTIAEHLTNYNSGNVLRSCTTEFCPAFIFAPGASGPSNTGHAILKCRGCNIGGGATTGNPVDWWSANDLSLTDTLIQNASQFSVRASQRRGSFGTLDIRSTHFEGAACQNPFGNVGCAGLLDQGYPSYLDGGTGVGSSRPNYGTNGDGSLTWVYYVTPVNSQTDALCTSQANDQRCVQPGGTVVNLGTGPTLPAGVAQADSSAGGTFTITWPAVREATSYILMRVTAPTGSSGTPLTQPYGSGSWLIASGINPATACNGSNGQTGGAPVCSYVDSVGLTPSTFTAPLYTFGSWYPFIDFWPCGLYVGPGSDTSGSSSYSFTRVIANSPVSDVCSANTLGSNKITVADTPSSTQYQGIALKTENQHVSNNGYNLGQALLVPTKTGLANSDGGIGVNAKGILNFGFRATSISYPFDILTLFDSSYYQTLLTVGNRPANGAGDTALGMDQSGGLSQRAATSISNYINSRNNNSSYLERLTASAKIFNVNTTINGNLTVTGSCTGCGGGGGGAVSSVFGRTGAVVATSGDYTASQVTNAVDLG